MSDKHALAGGGSARGIPGVQESLQFHHFPERGQCDFGVAGVAHADVGQFGIREFEVRHEDVDVARILLDHVRTLVSRRVKEEGDCFAASPQFPAQKGDVRPEVVGGDEIKIMNVPADQGQGGANQLFGCKGSPEVFHGNLVILAEKTAARAAREEEGAGAVGSGKRRFFAEMRTGRRDTAGRRFSATTFFPGCPVHPAVSRTQPAVLVG